jgi:hypothetical protein
VIVVEEWVSWDMDAVASSIRGQGPKLVMTPCLEGEALLCIHLLRFVHVPKIIRLQGRDQEGKYDSDSANIVTTLHLIHQQYLTTASTSDHDTWPPPSSCLPPT